MRIILFTGKGGVGKTTIAAATAIKAAGQGYKTLVISTDPAHSLSDALDFQLSPEPTLVSENLYAQEFDVYYSMQKHWKNIRQLMLTVFRWQGFETVLAEEMSALPGMEEASAFMWIEKYYSEKTFDLIVIDSAPTGETLTLLTLPQVTKWWVTKAFPFQKFAIKAVGKVVRGTTGIPLDKGYEELQSLFDKLERVQKIFSDPNVCSIRLVTNPEHMVINETKRAYTYLQLYGYNIDALIVNRIYPADELAGIFQKYLDSQKKHLREIEEDFSEIPIFRAAHLREEVFGVDLLSKISESIYADEDPVQVFHQEKLVELEEKKDGFLMKIKLSFFDEKQFKLKKFGDELILEIGNRRKNFFLPRFANFYTLGEHKFVKPWLIVKLNKAKN